ncbi:hypothetical protein B0H17DRAFT_1162226 [Mycena rosella]|uniref:Uncharacterized protein n=1 Tax=Mycena rosella TaxID=1033263 RepID=A0AAD7D1T5_MYCRO|nr:hypothetical protein B0H17DRAFT_1162226 [Mycena rosella]
MTSVQCQVQTRQGHLIFDTVNSLLQHWPNTRYRNGHNIIPGTVPAGTLLYHGRPDSNIPTVPDWTATDPEHAYPFCGLPADNATITGCWQLTFAVMRPLKVLYFDGSSAANMEEGGTMDAQDLLAWEHVDPMRWAYDRERLEALCAWGSQFGIDGYVRMEEDFEVMLCDFTAGVELLSAELLAALWDTSRFRNPGARAALRSTAYHNSPSSPIWTNNSGAAPGLGVSELINFESVRAGSWHNRYPGETRIVLDLSRLISFYDTDLVPSLIPYRASLERWDHRVHNISAPDLRALTTRLRAVLSDPAASDPGSGIDWKTLYRVVVDRYAERLELLDYLLNTTDATNATARGETLQAQLRIILTPYTLQNAQPTSANDSDAWAAPVWRGCTTRHTAHIHTSSVLRARLTASERLLLRALDETSREICRVVVRMWIAGVRAGLDPLIPLPKTTTADPRKISHVVEGWRSDARTLMAWLDWSVWIKCRPACGEMCYLPTWPFFYFRPDRDKDEHVWKRPQPRCIRMFEPYSQL